MTRIGKARVCRTVGELKVALKNLPDNMEFGGFDGCMSVEIWRLNKKDDPCSYDEERENAEMEHRKPYYKRLTIEEGEND